MKKLLIVIGAFAMMRWAYLAGERAAIRACVDDLEAPEEKTDEPGTNPTAPDPDEDVETPEPGEGEGPVMDDETASFIGMQTNF